MKHEMSPTLTTLLDQVLSPHEKLFTPAQQQALREQIDSLVNYQAAIGVLGKSGAGKSSLCNALFGDDITEVDDVRPCTRYAQEVTLGYRNGKGIALLDMPGIGESEEQDQHYIEQYRDMIPELDLILWLIKLDDRALSHDVMLYQKLLQPYCQQHRLPILFILSQADKAAPNREWDWHAHQPGMAQQETIYLKVSYLAQLFAIPEQQICVVSAEEHYGLSELMHRMILCLPQERRWSVCREARPEFVSGATRHASEDGLLQAVITAASGILREGLEKIVDGLTSGFRKLFGWL